MKIELKCVLFAALLAIVQFQCAAGLKEKALAPVPIIYSPHYNISVLGVENFHPFDSKKYRKVYKGILSGTSLRPSQFFSPREASDGDLLLVHTPDYLASLRHSGVVARIVEIPPLRMLPNFILRNGILKPMRYATGGTILGGRLALDYGWAINLSGGYHHAKGDNGGGFCVFADVPIALHSLWKEKPGLKVLIVDLDAHQGNGNSSLLGNDPRLAILDMYNASIYPCDGVAEKLVRYPVRLPMRTNTRRYLDSLSKWLPIAVSDFKPGLIVYNAGTDILCEDRLGGLSITEDGIIGRDDYVFKTALLAHIPILMVLSGGYNKKSGGIIARSINHFLESNALIKKASQ
jgi:histone deacetylase 11